MNSCNDLFFAPSILLFMIPGMANTLQTKEDGKIAASRNGAIKPSPDESNTLRIAGWRVGSPEPIVNLRITASRKGWPNP